MTLGEFKLEDSLGPHCRDSRRQADSKCAGSVIRGVGRHRTEGDKR